MAAADGRGRAWVAAVLFVAVFAVYQQSRVVNSFDSLWSVHAALSLWRRGDLDLDEYRAVIPPDDYRVTTAGGRLVSVFPLGTPILAAPLVGLYDLAYRAQGVDLDADLRTAAGRRRATRVEKTVACLLAAAAAAVVFAIGLARLPLGGALVLAAVFAFCTPAWSLASRGLWQHGPTMLLLALALYLFVVAERRPRAAVAAAAPLAFALLVRPTNAIPLAAFTVLVAVRHRRRLLPFLAVTAAVLVPFLAYDLALYRALLPPYYAASRLAPGTSSFFTALAANLVSPARGLLVFSPVLAFAGWGAWRRARSGGWTALDTALAASVGGLWLAVSSFPHWWAGHCYGPRFLSDAVPFLAWFLIPALAALAPGEGRRRWSRRAAAGLFAAAAAVSAAIHFRGAHSRATVAWNSVPVNVDEHPERVWDWRDPPWLRGIG